MPPQDDEAPAREPHVKHNAHIPTDDERDRVRDLAAMGFTQAQIARRIGITVKTLRARYRDELDEGYDSLHAELAQTAVGLARGGDKTMLIFVLKARFGWSDRPDRPVDGADAIARDTDPEVNDRGEAPP